MKRLLWLALITGCHHTTVAAKTTALREFDDDTCYSGFGCCAGYIRDPETEACLVDWNALPPGFWDVPSREPVMCGDMNECTDRQKCLAACASGLQATNDGCGRSSRTREECRVCMQPHVNDCQLCAHACGASTLQAMQACPVRLLCKGAPPAACRHCVDENPPTACYQLPKTQCLECLLNADTACEKCVRSEPVCRKEVMATYCYGLMANCK